jgi:hypothetical protein
MNSPEEYLRAADRLAQEVVNAWGANVKAGNVALLTPQFKALFETARRYRDAKNLANNHRKHNVLEPREEAEEKSTREEFAEAYRAFEKEHTQSS